MSRRIIAFVGPAGSGKTTLANEIMEYPDTYRIPIANRIRQVAEMAYGKIDKSESYTLRSYGKIDWDLNGRQVLQEIGGALRFFDLHFWLKALDRQIADTPDNAIIVIEDIRLDAEVQYLRDRYQTWVILCHAAREVRMSRIGAVAGEMDITETDWRHVKPDLRFDTQTESIEACVRIIVDECLS